MICVNVIGTVMLNDTHLLGKVKFKWMSVARLYESSPMTGTLLQLCDIRDGNPNGIILLKGELNHLIQTICL